MHFRRIACRSSVASLLALNLWAVQAQATVPQRLAVADALNLYQSGGFEQFFDLLSRDGAVDRRLFDVFERDANRWVKESAALRERRTIVASAVALEIAHVLRDKPSDWPGRYLVWASKLMRQNPSAVPSAALVPLPGSYSVG
jgi:hypothetical protein